MPLKSLLSTALLLCSAGVFADESALLTTEQLQSKQASECGYWSERDVEVCDQRTVYVDQPYKQCNYIRTSSSNTNLFPANMTKRSQPHLSCEPYFTLGGQGVSPHANYSITSEEMKTEQVAKTEPYNCRIETRWVWVQTNSYGRCDEQIAPEATNN